MKILWIVNKIFPYPSKKLGIKESFFGGWLYGLAENLKTKQNIDLAIATVYSGKKILELNDENLKYFLIPGISISKYDKKLEKYWKIIESKFKPDIVHIHGTEYSHGLAFLNACPQSKCVISIQGLVSACEKVYYANIPTSEIIRNITFRDIIKSDNLFEQKKKFKQRGKNEINMLKKAKFVIGRTDWDFSNVKAINPNLKYFKCNEILRKEFYGKEWNIQNIEKDTIFCSQAGYPIKGFHYLIEAISILKKEKPNIKVYVGGVNLIDNNSVKSKIKRTGYAKYVKELIKKYNLQPNIKFLDLLNSKQMLEQLLKSNIFVLPSAIENSSNSLGEAMILGMPCVVTSSGGTMDMLENKKEGFIYPYTEPAMCAEYMYRFLNSNDLCIKYGNNARITALDRHNPSKNTDKIISIYKEILSK